MAATAREGRRDDLKGEWRFGIVLAKALTSFHQQGLLKSFGVLIPVLVTQLDCSHSTMGFITSLHTTMMYVGCSVAQRLVERFKYREIATAGGVLVFLAITCVCFALTPVSLGICLPLAGLGSSMLYQTSSVAIKEYYEIQFGTMNTVAMMLAITGSIVTPFLTRELYEAYGLKGTFLVLGGISANLIPIGMTIKRPEHTRRHGNGRGEFHHVRVIDSSSEEEPDEERPSADIAGGSSEKKTTAGLKNKPSHEQVASLCTCIQAVARVFAIETLKRELHFTLFYLPCQLLIDFVYIGWALFVVSYGRSVGIDEKYAPFLVITGATGGCVSRIFLSTTLRFRPHWSFGLFLFYTVLLCTALGVLSISSSLNAVFSLCFVGGFGMYGGFAAYYGAVSCAVSPESFPEIIAFSHLITGMGIPFAGMMTGLLYDITKSFRIVFRIFAGLEGLVFGMSLIYISVCARKRHHRQKNAEEWSRW